MFGNKILEVFLALDGRWGGGEEKIVVLKRQEKGDENIKCHNLNCFFWLATRRKE